MSGKLIDNLVAGESPTLLSASKANELVDALNALQNITIQYGENFEATYGSNGVVLTIPRVEQVAATSEIDAEELVLNVCIDGENIEKTFYVKP